MLGSDGCLGRPLVTTVIYPVKRATLAQVRWTPTTSSTNLNSTTLGQVDPVGALSIKTRNFDACGAAATRDERSPDAVSGLIALPFSGLPYRREGGLRRSVARSQARYTAGQRRNITPAYSVCFLTILGAYILRGHSQCLFNEDQSGLP